METKQEKDLLDIFKDRIEKEAMLGDITDGVTRSGYSRTTYYSGQKRTKYADLKAGEVKVFEAIIKILDERKERNEKIKREYAGTQQ